MDSQTLSLPTGKKLYFASDFHLGVPTAASSLERERHIVAWLESIRHDAHAVYLLGDIFDFWFEYRHAIPKGFIRLQGKLAELRDSGVAIAFFTGNHDMWMFDYFPTELGIPIYREPIELLCLPDHRRLGPGSPDTRFLRNSSTAPCANGCWPEFTPISACGLHISGAGRAASTT